MKLGICGDVHFCKYSSIVRSRGKKYSTRLENLIESVNWFEHLCEENNCDIAVYLGDFFDQSELDAESITALKEIKWNDLSHTFLVGNHECGLGSLEYNSAEIFSLCPSATIISKPSTFEIDNTQVVFLPYILETDRKPIEEYLEETNKKRVIFSHNDIAGIQLGQIVSKNGFSIEKIENNCDLFINGHLHNGSKITNKIINLGNITGQNFSEDAFIYSHNAMVLDLDDLSYKLIINPYALNFYKLDFTEKNDIDYINDVSNKIKNNAIVNVKVYADDSGIECIKTRFLPDYEYKGFPKHCNIICGKLQLEYRKENVEVEEESSLITTDYFQQFQKYIIDNVSSSDIIKEELGNINQ